MGMLTHTQRMLVRHLVLFICLYFEDCMLSHSILGNVKLYFYLRKCYIIFKNCHIKLIKDSFHEISQRTRVIFLTEILKKEKWLISGCGNEKAVVVQGQNFNFGENSSSSKWKSLVQLGVV